MPFKADPFPFSSPRSHSLSSPERRSSNCVQKEVAVGFPDVGMTRPGLSRDTHLFNPTWPPRMWSQQLVVIVKARAEASSPGRASKSESELLNWTSSTRESCSPSLPFMGWDCPTLFLAVWLCWLLSSSWKECWKSPPRLKFHVCVHEPIQAIARSRFCTLFPISLSISFFHPCHLPNEIDWYTIHPVLGSWELQVWQSKLGISHLISASRFALKAKASPVYDRAMGSFPSSKILSLTWVPNLGPLCLIVFL